MNENDLTALAELPQDLLLTDPKDIQPYVQDWRGQKEGHAIAVFRPRTVNDVQMLVRWANQHDIAIVPQGGNTGLVGGSVPEAAAPRPTIILSMRRMQAIRSIDADGLNLVAEAGAILADVHDASEAVGCRFPLSLGSKGSATVGGLVSTNAGGVQVLRHGPMRSLVLGLEAVLPNGEILNQLSALRKDNTGYDIKQLLIGAEGTLGVVTAVALKLAPAFQTVSTAWVAVPDAHAALALLGHLRRHLGERVESFELAAYDALELVVQQFPDMKLPVPLGAPFHVLIEAEVDTSRLEDVLAQAMELGLVLDGSVASTRAQVDAMWGIRENIPIAERQTGSAVKNDISVPVARLADFQAEAVALFAKEWPGARPFVFGHLGDGNLHWNLRAPIGVDSKLWVRDNGDAIRRLLHDLIASYDGSISAEHGIGTLKADELNRLGDPGKLQAMQLVKRALDPKNILNPWKIFT